MSVSALERVFDSWENENGPEPGVGSTGRGLTLNRTQLDWRAAMQSTQPCNVPGCDRPGVLLGKTICRAHYQRKWRGRDTDAPLRRVRTTGRGECAVEGCEDLDAGPDGYCVRHLYRWKRRGSTEYMHQKDRAIPRGSQHDRWTGDAATYTAMHQRLRKARGRASDHACADCGAPARHWSYDRRDPDERTAEHGPYSVKLEHYEPRCVACHKAFDLRAIGKAK